MTKNVAALLCLLILAGFGALAAVEPAAPIVQPVLDSPVFMSQEACPQALSGALVPAPVPMTGCQGWLYGSCDRRADCTGFYCPLGEVKTCDGGTGSGCLGTCICVW